MGPIEKVKGGQHYYKTSFEIMNVCSKCCPNPWSWSVTYAMRSVVFVYVLSNGACVCVLYGRMRERGPCICGVGVWSLLLSLCLASLTQAHRSHTGRYMYAQSCVCVCCCTEHSPVPWSASVCSIHLDVSGVCPCRQPLQQSYSFTEKLNWIGRVPPEGMQRFDLQWNTRPKRIVARKTSKTFYNEGKGNTGIWTKKVFSVQGPIRARCLSKTPVGYSTRGQQWGSG